ncbi:PKD domain-containing protein [Blastococcus sp. PRF04-17]|nr:PKD domain-containing protein [Blastococcus sp. PRF04-17]
MVRTDTTAALQAAGGLGLTVHRPGNTTAATAVRFTGFRVTADGDGAVVPPPANSAPTATFLATPSGLEVSVDAAGSDDADGTVTGFSWNWGDGSPAGSGATATHTYAAAGTYTITLTVTDDDGATGTATRSVTVTAPPGANQPPTAAFAATPNGLSVTFDASGSSDPDGSVTGYAWDFGDGATATGGPGATHGYAAPGTYRVTLTVTDDDGTESAVSHDVTVSDAAGPEVLVDDTFGRTASNGLGTADVGGAWTASAGANRQSVAPGGAEMTLPAAGNNTGSWIGSGIGDADVLTTFSLSSAPTGNGTYVYVTPRRVGAGLEYRSRVRVLPDGRVALALSRLSGGTEAFPGGEVFVPGLTWAPGSSLTVRVVATGSGTGTTQLATTVWLAGTTEPAAPQMVRTDTTAALQASGGVGLTVHRPGGTTAATTVRFTSFRVTAQA